MTRTYPLSLQDFALKLLIKHFDWKWEDQQEISGTGGGDMIGVDVAPGFWRSPVVLDHMTHRQAAEVQAIIESLGGVLNGFYFHDPRQPYPAFDPKGTVLGNATVRIKAISANNKEIQLKGLTPGFQIGTPDWFHRDYGTNPVYRGYHRVNSPVVTANINGETDWIEFRPHFYPGSAAVNDVVVFARPSALCKILPKTFNPGQSRGTRNYGMSFEIRQVPR